MNLGVTIRFLPEYKETPREQRMRVFQPAEAVICAALIIAAIVGIVLISTGYLAL
jgi:hypothetical protein